jgi:predicted enzyme related to lactoylglutathione lyase
MTSGIKTVVYPVKDADRAKAVFTALLGAGPHTDSTYYIGYNVAGQEIGLDPNGHSQGLTGPLVYWHVPDVAAAVQELTAAGAELTQPVRDVGGGKLIAALADADGNPIGLIQEQ